MSLLFLMTIVFCISCGGNSVQQPVRESDASDARTVLSAGAVGSIATRCAEDIVIYDNTMYIADGPGGLIVVDIAKRSKPLVVKTIPTEYAIRLYIYKNHLYLCDGPAGLKVFMLSAPHNPVMTFSAESEWSTSATFNGGILYMGDYFGGIQVYDVSSPSVPIYIKTVKRSRVRDIIYENGNLLVCDAPFGLASYITYDPQTPSHSYTDGSRLGNFEDIIAHGNYAIIARNDGKSSISVFDIANLSDVSVVNEKFPARFIDGLNKCGNYLLASCGEDGVIAYSLPELPKLERLWRVDTPNYARRAKIEGDYLYVADMAEVVIYDLKKIGGRIP